MTLNVNISINGNYKTTYTVNGVARKITGRGNDGPKQDFIHVSEPTTIVIQPDEPDNGEPQNAQGPATEDPNRNTA